MQEEHLMPHGELKTLRVERNRKLAETDWEITKHKELGTNIPTALKTYRQALRDITNDYTSLDDVVYIGETIMALIKVNNRGQSSDFSLERGATKNLIINTTDMRIAQRGTSQTNAGVNSIDRMSWSTSGATETFSQQSTTIALADQLVLINLQE